jgi:hypothetical protein
MNYSKLTLLLFIFMLGFYSGYLLNQLNTDSNNKDNKTKADIAEVKLYESQMGKKIIIGKDTLMVTNYNYNNDDFVLSNGTTVNKALIFKKSKQ